METAEHLAAPCALARLVYRSVNSEYEAYSSYPRPIRGAWANGWYVGVCLLQAAAMSTSAMS